MLALAVDGLIVLLLLLVLGRGFQLQRQFTELRQQDGELDRLIAALDCASGRAEAALGGLRQTAETTGERVTAQLTSAQRLIDDLQFLISRGEQAADRLVEQISRDRPGNQRGLGAAAVPDPVRAGDGPQRGGRARAHAQDAALMPWRPWRAGTLVRPHARHRPAAPVTIMAALGILALAKLGLLAADMVGPGPAAGSPAAEQAPSPRASASISIAQPDQPDPMPAAGPGPAGHGSTGPKDRAPPASAAEHAAAPAENFDPSRISAGEVAVLEQLAARRSALDQRARELDRRQALLETAAATLDARIAELSELRNQIAKAVEQHDAAEEAKIRSLVKIYETMKAKAAAEIFNRLEMPVLIQVVERMHEPKSADVLARMDPVKAKQVTTELARRSKLLDTAVPDSSSAASPSNGG